MSDEQVINMFRDALKRIEDKVDKLSSCFQEHKLEHAKIEGGAKVVSAIIATAISLASVIVTLTIKGCK